MSYILAAFFVLALVCGGISGRMAEVSAAAMEGAGAAVELCLSMAGAICLWSGVMTLMERGGLSEKLARGRMRRSTGRILPRASRDTETMAALSATCRPICWGWATPPLRWGSVPPRGWRRAAAAWPATSCAALWC